MLLDETIFTGTRNGMVVLTTMGPGPMSSRRTSLCKLCGALTALHILFHGTLAEGISPVWIQLMVNDGDPNFVSPEFVEEFDPEFWADWTEWKAFDRTTVPSMSSRLHAYICSYESGYPVRQ